MAKWNVVIIGSLEFVGLAGSLLHYRVVPAARAIVFAVNDAARRLGDISRQVCALSIAPGTSQSAPHQSRPATLARTNWWSME